MASMLPRSSGCLLKGASKAVMQQGGSRGVATVMADLPEEHVSFDIKCEAPVMGLCF